MVDLSALSNFKAGLPAIAQYSWVLWIFVPLAVIIFAGVMIKTIRDKKRQWTHTLIVKRVLTNGMLSKEVKHKMKRFPIITGASVFELEKSLLGKYLITEFDSYTGINEFSVIVDKNNRLLINKGEKFEADSGYVIVSGKHASIDLAWDDLGKDYQKINQTASRTEWAKIAKFAMIGLLIIAVMVVSIKGIGQWGENHKINANRATAEAETMRQLAEAMKTSQATMNSQVLILNLFKEIYGTNNIQNILEEQTNATIIIQ